MHKFVTWAYSKKLKPGPKFVLVALADATNQYGECWPSHQTISEMTGYEARAIQSHIKTLVELGLIEKSRRHTKRGKRTSDMYLLNMNKDEENREEKSLKNESANLQKIPVAKNTSGNIYQKQKKTALPAKSAGTIYNDRTVSDPPSPLTPQGNDENDGYLNHSREEWLEFWKSYPKKIKLEDARNAFDLARGNVDHNIIMDGVKNYAIAVSDKEERFISEPARWLKAKRWTDEHKNIEIKKIIMPKARKFPPEQPWHLKAKNKFTTPEFESWIRVLFLNDSGELVAPSRFVADWVRNNYQNKLFNIFGQDAEITFKK